VRSATGGRDERVFPFTHSISRPTFVGRAQQRWLQPRLILSLVVTLAASTSAYAQQAKLVTHPTIGTGKSSASQLSIDRGAQSPVRAARSQDCNRCVEAKLARAFSIALDSVQTHQSCRTLFARLGVDGSDMLGSILYRGASASDEQRMCRRCTVAFTCVGRPATTLCRKFSRLSDQKAAVLVLHEALHSAGLSERPHDPKGMSPAEIDGMVERNCGFTGR